uniref:Uncharacterized protein n=1 Tax=Molossus molossus TaxID=27622 RepID=A0A7J8FSP1_MOLMO|nr:hypothetical protein HJG59_008323 [Molossus molossus]
MTRSYKDHGLLVTRPAARPHSGYLLRVQSCRSGSTQQYRLMGDRTTICHWLPSARSIGVMVRSLTVSKAPGSSSDCGSQASRVVQQNVSEARRHGGTVSLTSVPQTALPRSPLRRVTPAPFSCSSRMCQGHLPVPFLPIRCPLLSCPQAKFKASRFLS